MGTTKYQIVGRGCNGWHASGRDVSISGAYSEQPPAEWLHKGALVYDAESADQNAFVRFVMAGPMVDAGLAKGEAKRFGSRERETALRMCGPGGLSGGFDSLVLLEAAQQSERPFEFGSFDSVDPYTYLALIRKHVPGTRCGRVVEDGRVDWETP